MQSNSPFTSSSASPDPTTAPFSGPGSPPSDLGALLAQHHGKYLKYIFLGLFLVVFGGAALLNWRPSEYSVLIMGLVCVPGGFYSLYFAWRVMTSCAYAYEEGLVLECAGKQQTVRWEAIQTCTQAITRHYTNGIYTHTSHLYTLVLTDGTKIKLNDNYKKVAGLGEIIQTEVSKVQLPRYVADFQAGRPVTFGDLVFDSNGITRGKTFIAWSEFKYMDFKNGVLRIHKDKEGLKEKLLTGGSIAMQVSTLPNLYTLAAFVQHLPAYGEG